MQNVASGDWLVARARTATHRRIEEAWIRREVDVESGLVLRYAMPGIRQTQKQKLVERRTAA